MCRGGGTGRGHYIHFYIIRYLFKLDMHIMQTGIAAHLMYWCSLNIHAMHYHILALNCPQTSRRELSQDSLLERFACALWTCAPACQAKACQPRKSLQAVNCQQYRWKSRNRKTAVLWTAPKVGLNQFSWLPCYP